MTELLRRPELKANRGMRQATNSIRHVSSDAMRLKTAAFSEAVTPEVVVLLTLVSGAPICRFVDIRPPRVLPGRFPI